MSFVYLSDRTELTRTEHEEEMFEDDPNEYIRMDLEPSTGMPSSRRECQRANFLQKPTRGGRLQQNSQEP